MSPFGFRTTTKLRTHYPLMDFPGDNPSTHTFGIACGSGKTSNKDSFGKREVVALQEGRNPGIDFASKGTLSRDSSESSQGVPDQGLKR